MTIWDEVRALVEERTRGWPEPRKAAAWHATLRQLVRQSPAMLAAAVDPTTVQTPALDLIDQALIDCDEGRCDRLIITMPPQEGKTTRVARTGVLWAMTRDPDRRAGIASYAESLALGSGKWIRDTIEAHGAPTPGRPARPGQRDILGIAVDPASRAKGEFYLAGRRGGVYSVGVRGGMTGRPMDWVAIDDPFKDRVEADSLTIREAVWAWWTDVVVPRLAPGAVVIVVMTLWHEDDLVGRLLAEDAARPGGERQWRVIRVPAQAEDDDPLGREPGEFLQSARGRTRQMWERIKASVGARTWAALYQGRPAPAEGGIFQWDWIRPYRLAGVPALARVVVAVDPSGGGHDEAGIIAAGRAFDGRTVVLGDRSQRATMGGQWRLAWLAVLDFEADELVYEANLVDPAMRRAIPAAWARMRDQAAALDRAGALRLDLADVDDQVLTARVEAAAEQLVGAGDDDVRSADEPLAALVGQLHQVLPYAARVLAAPERGPARVTGVHATRGKRTRAEPVAQAYETGRVAHAGVFHGLEQQQVTWQEGQDSPDRVDALVWAWVALNTRGAGRVSSPAGRTRVDTGPSTRRAG